MISPRRAAPALALAGLLLGLTGCVGEDAEPSVQPPGQQPPGRLSPTATGGTGFGAPSGVPTSTPGAPTASGTPYDGPIADSPVCQEVVAGINDFNEGDFEGTVAHFEDAVPLAQAADDGSREAEDLLAAVRYYADLAPEDYPQASRSSLDFAQYKAITLGLCVEQGDLTLPTPTSPGLSA